MRVIQGRNLNISCLPSQEQTKQEQYSLVGIQQAQPDFNAVDFTRICVRQLKNIVILVIVL